MHTGSARFRVLAPLALGTRFAPGSVMSSSPPSAPSHLVAGLSLIPLVIIAALWGLFTYSQHGTTSATEEDQEVVVPAPAPPAAEVKVAAETEDEAAAAAAPQVDEAAAAPQVDGAGDDQQVVERRRSHVKSRAAIRRAHRARRASR